MVAVTDQNQRIALASELHCFNVDLRDQGASRVNHTQFAELTLLPHFRGDAVRAVNDPLALRNLAHAVNKDCAFLLEFLYNKPVVDDLLADVDGRSKGFQCDPDNVDGPHHSSAESTWLQKQ